MVRLVWSRQNEGNIKSLCGSASDANGHKIQVASECVLDIQVWEILFIKDVRVVSTLPDNVPAGSRFWRRRGLWLDKKKTLHLICALKNI